MKPQWMPEDVEPQQIIDLYRNGYSAIAIIEKLGLTCSYAPVLRFLKDKEIAIRKPGKSGSNDNECLGCTTVFISKYSDTPLCLDCAPDKSWRQRFNFYGITKPQFDEILERQSSLCDLCELPLPENISKISIDHCHKQGHVRALLHHRCNVGLAFIEDDKFLANAVRYVERHKK